MNPISKFGTLTSLTAMTAHTLTKIYRAQWRKAPAEEIVNIYQSWAKNLFAGMGYQLEVSGEKVIEEPCLYVGNHLSFLDIPHLWTCSQGVFVAKKEVRSWPLIGAGAEALGTVWVDRSSMQSRAKALETIRDAISIDKKRICIFPSGTSNIEGKPWRWGVFKLAKELDIPIQPFRLFYCPLRESAYIDDDTLTTQWWRAMNVKTKTASIEWGKAQKIVDFQNDAKAMQQWVSESFNKKRIELSCG